MHLRLVFVPRRFFIAYFPVNNSLVPAGGDKFLTGTFAPIKKATIAGGFLSTTSGPLLSSTASRYTVWRSRTVP